ncbi:MAG: hypothetical protein OXU71_03175 [Gammaproteobacteria bacterium]|nr:hypothetical protein [Gammaproteobacteria bacterium]
MKKSLTLLLVAVAVAGLPGGAGAGRVVLPAPGVDSLAAIPVCHDFGCKRMATVQLPGIEWQGVAGWFFPRAATPAEERARIARALGWMEVLIGRRTPTHKDLALDLPPGRDLADMFPGQLDCIDEAVNTTTYMKLFVLNGLIKHHTVVEAAYRRSLFNQHWAAQIEEARSGKRFTVDSWFRPNGYPPVVQRAERWHDLNPLTALADENKRPFWRRLLRGE